MYLARRNNKQHDVNPVENFANSENCRLCLGMSIFSDRICNDRKFVVYNYMWIDVAWIITQTCKYTPARILEPPEHVDESVYHLYRVHLLPLLLIPSMFGRRTLPHVRYVLALLGILWNCWRIANPVRPLKYSTSNVDVHSPWKCNPLIHLFYIFIQIIIIIFGIKRQFNDWDLEIKYDENDSTIVPNWEKAHHIDVCNWLNLIKRAT